MKILYWISMAEPEVKVKVDVDASASFPANYYVETANGREHKLNNKWVLWRHTLDSRDWSIKGYDKIATFDTVEEFWRIYNDLPTLTHDMWFLMRDGIPPIWEHEINQEGGSFKFRIKKDDADNSWLTLSMYLVSENMCRNPMDAELISGLSISPKRGVFVTLSVWNLDKTSVGQAIFPSNIPGIDFKASLYQCHSDRDRG